MAERPILFSGAMVRALLAGRKTQTRRVLKFGSEPPVWAGDGFPTNDPNLWAFRYYDKSCDCTELRFLPDVPRFAVGDRLYVRETWGWYVGKPNIEDFRNGVPVFYRADDGSAECHGVDWRSSRFMPRWASRITLTVTDVRVQRLQEISEADALAEGVFRREDDLKFPWAARADCTVWYPDPFAAYAFLWTEINGLGSWDRNPWVAAYTFTVELRNIDAGKEPG